MKRLIHSYLDLYFCVEGGGVFAHNKYFNLTSWFIISELEKIFVMEKSELKWYVKSWIRKYDKSFDFKSWWTPVVNLVFPTIKRITANTIASDLVRVAPMGEPRGQLFYLDYILGVDPIDPPTNERRILIQPRQRIQHVDIEFNFRPDGILINDR